VANLLTSSSLCVLVRGLAFIFFKGGGWEPSFTKRLLFVRDFRTLLLDMAVGLESLVPSVTVAFHFCVFFGIGADTRDLSTLGDLSRVTSVVLLALSLFFGAVGVDGVCFLVVGAILYRVLLYNVTYVVKASIFNCFVFK
jgi:hypothetical protein